MISVVPSAVPVKTLNALFLRTITVYQITFQFVSGNIHFLRILTGSLIIRWKPYSNVYTPKESFALTLGIGNMDSGNIVLDDGIMFSVYETGPWVGFKLTGNPTMGWIGGGTTQYDFMVVGIDFSRYQFYIFSKGLEALMHVFEQKNRKI